MSKVKIKNIKTGAIKEVEKSLAGDFIGTRRFELVEEKKSIFSKPSFIETKESKEK